MNTERLQGPKEYKFTVVVNKDLRDQPGTSMNAVAHVCAGLVAKAAIVPSTIDQMQFLDYPTGEDSVYDNISAHGIVVLSAKASHLRQLRQKLQAAQVLTVAFCDAMVTGTTDEQLERIRSAQTSDLTDLAIAMFGPASLISPLTKRFSLWR